MGLPLEEAARIKWLARLRVFLQKKLWDLVIMSQLDEITIDARHDGSQRIGD